MKKLMFGLMGLFSVPALAVSFSYQGVLRGATGEEIADRNKVITFRLYDNPTSETALWGRTSAVLLDANGLFNIELGDATGSGVAGLTNSLEQVLSANAGGTLYIGLKVEPSAGEIRPRQKVLSVPFASFASDANLAKRDFTIMGEAHIKGALVADGDAKVEGMATVRNLSVKEDATLAGKVTFTGPVNLSSGKLELPANSTFTVGGKPAVIPSGVIVMWSGSKDNIPEGWALCDGSNGTPDLRGRFIVGAGIGEYTVGKKGGEERVTLKLEEIPAHQHYYLGDDELKKYGPSWLEDKGPEGVWDADSSTSPTAKDKGSHKYATTYSGEGKSHNNLPPYYALCYIMKK